MYVCMYVVGAGVLRGRQSEEPSAQPPQRLDPRHVLESVSGLQQSRGKIQKGSDTYTIHT